MDRIPILTKLKLLGYFWLAASLLLIVNIIYWCIYKFIPLPIWAIYTIDLSASSIGIYYMIKILLGYKQRCKTYIRLHNLYSIKIKKNEKIPTYHLYVMKHTLCGSVVVKQLCKEFNIQL